MSVEVDIGEVVLDGFPLTNRAILADALRLELARLLTERPVPTFLRQDAAVDDLDAGRFPVPPQAPPATLGIRLAGAIHDGLRR